MGKSKTTEPNKTEYPMNDKPKPKEKSSFEEFADSGKLGILVDMLRNIASLFFK